MRRLVLDAHAFLAWFGPNAPGSRMRAEYEAGQLRVIVPASFEVDVLEGAARAGWSAQRLTGLAVELRQLKFEPLAPPSGELATWLARGLTGRQAAYAALASAHDLPLAASDPALLEQAASVARTLSQA